MRRNKRNVGELNGMKNLEARQKVSVFRKKYFEKEENRIKVAQKLSDCWKNGKFDNVKTGLCKWYKYKHSSGVEYKVQGTWELAFIKWLDDNNLNFTCHKGRLSYFFNNVNRNYYPDFWINEWNCYVDIKGPQFYDESKFNAIKEFNKDVKILILFDKNLKEIGVNIDEKTKNFRHLEC